MGRGRQGVSWRLLWDYPLPLPRKYLLSGALYISKSASLGRDGAFAG